MEKLDASTINAKNIKGANNVEYIRNYSNNNTQPNYINSSNNQFMYFNSNNIYNWILYYKNTNYNSKRNKEEKAGGGRWLMKKI